MIVINMEHVQMDNVTVILNMKELIVLIYLVRKIVMVMDYVKVESVYVMKDLQGSYVIRFNALITVVSWGSVFKENVFAKLVELELIVVKFNVP
jgi:hypothetical protein